MNFKLKYGCNTHKIPYTYCIAKSTPWYATRREKVGPRLVYVRTSEYVMGFLHNRVILLGPAAKTTNYTYNCHGDTSMIIGMKIAKPGTPCPKCGKPVENPRQCQI